MKTSAVDVSLAKHVARSLFCNYYEVSFVATFVHLKSSRTYRAKYM